MRYSAHLLAAAGVAAALAAPAAAVAAPAAVTPATKSCKSVTRNISYLSIGRTVSKPPSGFFTCQMANAVGDTWMLRFNDHMQVRAFTIDFKRYTCKLVPSLPRNQQCVGAGTRIRFSAPTGG
jgi:hypothetical protein